MHHIIISSKEKNVADAKTVDSMFVLRDKVFNKKLKWDINSVNGREIDQYDELDPIYMIAVNKHKLAEGCWRILSTQNKYMLKDTFPALLRGEEAPVDSNIWELSRFAVSAAGDNSGTKQINLSDLTFEMVRHVYDFAIENNIDHYVTVTSVAVERLMLKAGIPMIRFGDGEASKIGKVRSVACWIPINDQFCEAVYNLNQAVA